MMMAKERISKVLLAVLMGTLLQTVFPTPSGSVAPVITKTVTVKDSSNNPVQGAIVQLIFNDVSGTGQRWQQFSESVTTNSSGVAVVTAPDSVEWIQLVVQPTGTALAIYANYQISLDDEEIDVKLQNSNFKLNILRSDGSNPVLGGGFGLNKIGYTIIRPGPFGVYLDAEDVAGGYLWVYPDQGELTSQTYNSYQIKNVTTGGSTSINLFSETGTALTADGSGVFTARYLKSNLSGTLINPDGTPYILPEGVSANIRLWVLHPAGYRWYEAASNIMRNGDDNWNMDFQPGEAAKVEISVEFINSLTLGQSGGTTFFVNASNKFSLSETGTFSSTLSIPVKVVPTVPTFGFIVKDSTTAQNLVAANYSLYSENSKVNFYTNLAATKGNLTLPNGTYSFDISPAQGSKQMWAQYTVVVNGSNVTITDSDGRQATSSGKVFDLILKPLDLKLTGATSAMSKALRSGFNINAWTYVSDGDGNYWEGTEFPYVRLESATVGAILQNGTYKVSTTPNSTTGYGRTFFTIVKSASGYTLNGAAVPSDGVFKIALNASNFKYKLVDPADSSKVIKNGWVDFCPQIDAETAAKMKANGQSVGPEYQQCFSGGGDLTGQGSVYLETGTWLVYVNGDESALTKTYTARVNASHEVTIDSVTANGSGVFSLTQALPNFTGSLYESDGTTQINYAETQNATVSLEFIDANGYAEELTGSGVNFWNKNFSFNLEQQGKYRLIARPNNIKDYSTTTSQYIYVNGSGQLSLDSTTGFASSISNFKLALKPGNFPVMVVNPVDQSLLTDFWAYAYPQKGKGSPQYFGFKMGRSSLANLNFEAGSDYVIYMRPFNNPSLSESTYYVSVSLAGDITVSDGKNPVLKTNGRYILSPKMTNINGQIVQNSGATLPDGAWVDVQLQRLYQEKNYWEPIRSVGVEQDGLFGFPINDAGTYRVFARPSGDINLGTITTNTFTVASESVSSYVLNLGKVALSTPTMKFKAKVAGSSSFVSYYGATLFKDGNYIDNPYVNKDGIGALTFESAGSYELWLNPYKLADRSVTPKKYKIDVTKSGNNYIYSVITSPGSSTSGGYTIFEFGSPNLKGVVTNSDSTVAVADIPVLAVNSVNLKEGWQNYSQTDANGNWSMTLERGTYKIFARAPGGSILYANSDYIGDVVVDETGTVTSIPAGQSATNFIVKLNAPTWSGVVKNPAGDAVVSYAGVCLEGYSSFYKGNYGWCANSNAQGQWALFKPSTVTLDENSYLRVYDWNNNQYPTLIVKGKTAIEAMIGTSGSNKVLKFPSPNLELTVKGAGSPVQGAWVNVYSKEQNFGANNSTNALGVSTMYLPTLTSALDVSIDVPRTSDAIQPYVSTSMRYTAQQVLDSTTSGVFKATVNLKTPNLKGIVRDPVGNSELTNTWIEVQNITDGRWAPGTSLGSNGTFGLYLPSSPNCGCQTEYIITVHAPGNTASVDKQYKAMVSSSDVVTLFDKRTNAAISTEVISSNTLYSMTLQQPNFKAAVREPGVGSTPGPLVSWSRNDNYGTSWAYAELYNITNNEWIPGQGVAEDGTLKLYLPGGCCRASKEYRLTLHPAWTSTGNMIKRDYKVVVDYNDSVTITDIRSGTVAGTEVLNGNTYLSLSLGKPNLSGLVVNKDDTAVAYSWVSIYPKWSSPNRGSCTTNECYMYSNYQGKFSTNLNDGSYDMYANPMWWGTFQGTQSSVCSITVETGTLTSANNCLQNDGSVKLKLRQPNLSFTLNDGTKPVSDAWVSVGIGNSWASGRSDENGFVGLFIDTSTVAGGGNQYEKDGVIYGGPLTGPQKIRVYVDPPWTSQNMARWNCESGDSKPVCNALTDYVVGETWTARNLGTITPPLPNTQIRVIRPDTNASAGWYNYLSVYRINPAHPDWWDWAGWSGTNGDGIATLNIETTTANASWKYKLYISPAWNLRNDFTGKMLDNNGAGYTFAQLNSLSFALGTPNLQVTSLLPDRATPNKWGWVSVEEVNDSLTTVAWVGSDGLNEYGKASFTLPSSKKFKVAMNPGPGRSGTTTFCYLQTDSGGLISKVDGQCAAGDTTTATAMTLVLARGNVVGKIKTSSGTGIVGAVIYANIVGATNEDYAVIACSNADGDYGLILKANQSYQIKVFPINKSGTTYLDKTDLAPLTITDASSTTLDVTLSS